MTLVGTEPVNRTILLLDIENFSGRDNHQQVILRRRLNKVTGEFLTAVGVGPGQEYREDRGDGFMILVSGDIPKTNLLRGLLTTLPDALRAENSLASADVQMRLRMVLAAGEVVPDQVVGTHGGVAGQDLNHAYRLLDASVLREALRQRDTDCVLCVSRSIFDGVVHHRYQGLDPEKFQRFIEWVKQDRIEGWLHDPEAAPHAPGQPSSGGGAVASAGRPGDGPRPGGHASGRPAAAPGHGRAAPDGSTRKHPSRRTYLTLGITAGILAVAGTIGSFAFMHGSHDLAAQKLAHHPRSSASSSTSPSASPSATAPGQAPSASAPANLSPSAPGLGTQPDGSKVYSEQFENHSLWTDDGHFVGASYGAKSYLVYSGTSAVRTYRIGYPKNVPVLYPRAPENVSIDVWARLDANATNGYGVVCRADADKTGYYFTIWGTSAYIERKSPGSPGWGTPLKVVPNSSVIKPTGQNHLQVSCIDSDHGSVQLAFRINGAVVAVAIDQGNSVIKNGTIALTAGSDRSTKAVGTAEFSNMAVGKF